MNADGNNLPVEVLRKQREEDAARRAAEHRAGMRKNQRLRTAKQLQVITALADGTAEPKLRALLKLAAEHRQRQLKAM